MTTYTWRQKGPEVVKLQEALMRKGYSLPKYGADGDLGGETWKKVEAYGKVDQYPTSQPLPSDITDSILDAVTPPPAFAEKPFGYIRVQGDPNDVHGMRSWSQIDTIVLHQTGIWMTDSPERFKTLDAHVAILKNHPTPIVQVQELNAYMWHANEANKFSIGIEINGHFPGLVRTFDETRHSSDGPSARQIESARAAVRWIMDEVSMNGGEIRHIIPHRVSNDVKQSDPGEVAWKTIGVWAQQQLGLTDKGPGYCIGDGTPIPRDWDSRPAYAKYRY